MRHQRPVTSRLYLTLFRYLLVVLPPTFRRRYGRDMTEALAASLDAAQGSHRRLWVFATAFWDLLPGIVPEWLDAISRRRRVRRNENLDRTAIHKPHGGWIELLARETLFAVRSLRREPGPTAVVVVTLALGIGANTALFSVIEGSLLRPLPYSDPDRLVWVSSGYEMFGGTGINQSIPNLMDLRRESKLLSSSAIYSPWGNGNLTTSGDPERVRFLLTSSEMLSTLGVSPLLGRDLQPGDDEAGSQKVALLTYGLWQRAFGADPGIVGRSISVDAEPVVVVGVTPSTFRFPGDPELIVPLQHLGNEYSRRSRMYYAVGRLAPGADLPGLRVELEGIFHRLVEEHPDANEGWSIWADPLREMATGRNRETLFLLAGAALVVLLMVCANAANLLMVRAEQRNRELAIRLAVGARRRDIFSVFLAEATMLSALGGLLGVLGAFWGTSSLAVLFSGFLQRADQISVNGTVLGFALVVSLLVGGLVGLIPAVRMGPGKMHDLLTQRSRGSTRGSSRMERSLVTGEVALGVLVVISAGLLMNSLWRLQRVELGVEDAERVLTFQLSLPAARYPEESEVRNFFSDLLLDLDATTGVEGVGFVNRLPLLGGASTGDFSVVGDPDRSTQMVGFRGVTPGYFETVGIPLKSGRWLDAAEFSDETTPSILINETLASQLFGDGDPLGQSVGPERREGGLRVVGVVGNVLGGNPAAPAPPAFYYPLFTNVRRDVSVVIRPSGDVEALLPVLQGVVARHDPDLPVFSVRTLGDIARARMGTQRLANSVFALFAALALLLGAVGVYGVMSSSVAHRSRELGVRLALGASGGSVLRLVLSQGVRMTLPGLMIGLGLASVTGSVLEGLLFDVRPLDPVTFGVVAALLGLVSMAATCGPALRAMRIDPMECIREE